MTIAALRLSTGRTLPTEYFVLANLRNEGPIIGRLADHPISETVIDDRGSSYRYVGVAPRNPGGRYDVEALRPGEWIVQPGLIYAVENKG
ncbi:MAG: hypothetical protein AB1440_19410 [Pseudomonadota bacterium]|jgi:hypothetical protein